MLHDVYSVRHSLQLCSRQSPQQVLIVKGSLIFHFRDVLVILPFITGWLLPPIEASNSMHSQSAKGLCEGITRILLYKSWFGLRLHQTKAITQMATKTHGSTKSSQFLWTERLSDLKIQKSTAGATLTGAGAGAPTATEGRPPASTQAGWAHLTRQYWRHAQCTIASLEWHTTDQKISALHTLQKQTLMETTGFKHESGVE